MSIIFTEKDKQLDLSIDGYEFDYSSNEISNTKDRYDANWLTIRVNYSENGHTQTYIDNCLLTYELDSLTKDIDKIVNHYETGLITDFLEPTLKLAISVAEGICIVQIRFVYDTTEVWKDLYISQAMTLNELQEINISLKEIAARFPVRRIGKKGNN